MFTKPGKTMEGAATVVFWIMIGIGAFVMFLSLMAPSYKRSNSSLVGRDLCLRLTS